jgi:hypothetical protein
VGDTVIIRKTGEKGILRHILVKQHFSSWCVSLKEHYMVSIGDVSNLASSYNRDEIEGISEVRDRKINNILK